MTTVTVTVIAKDTSISIRPSIKAVRVVPEKTTISIFPNASINGQGNAFDDQWIIVNESIQLKVGAYAVDALTLTTLTLPTNAVLGQSIKIYGLGNGGWRLAQGAGQVINIGNKSTTEGVSGNILSTEQGDYIELLYLDKWVCKEMIGNLQVN